MTTTFRSSTRFLAAATALIFIISGAAYGEIMHVTVSIPPLKYFAERIGGDRLNVISMADAGSDPHTFSPKPTQLKNLSDSRLYLAVGVGFEKAWLDRFVSVNPGMRIVNTDDGIEKIHMLSHHQHDGHEDEHGDDDEENDEAADPHIWLSPRHALTVARSIRDALITADPAGASAYKSGFDELEKDIATLDSELETLFDTKATEKTFLVFHPAWGYFADRYGLEQEAVEIEGKEPKPADLTRLIKFCREHGIKALFVQPQFSKKSARTIANAIDGKVIVADPLAENWLENMRGGRAEFQRSFTVKRDCL